MNIPSQVNGHTVVAFVPLVAYLDNGTSTHSGAVARVICEDHPDDYVVWTLYAEGNGEQTSGSGHYCLSYTQAVMTVMGSI